MFVMFSVVFCKQCRYTFLKVHLCVGCFHKAIDTNFTDLEPFENGVCPVRGSVRLGVTENCKCKMQKVFFIRFHCFMKPSFSSSHTA